MIQTNIPQLSMVIPRNTALGIWSHDIVPGKKPVIIK
jgi:hypothetical protein